MEKIPDEVRKQIEEKFPITEKVGYGHIQSNHKVQNKKRLAAEFGYSLANKEIEKYKEFIIEVSVSDPDGNPLRLINKARKILNNL